MENIEKGSKKKIQYNYSTEDISNFFEGQNLKLAIPYITHNIDGEEISGEKILLRMKEILNPNFSEERRKELAEAKQYIRNSISRYLKGKSNAEKINEVCPDSLPNYIKDNIDKLNKERTIYQKTVQADVANNFYGMYLAFKNIFNEYRENEFTEKEIITKVLKIFYNAEKKFSEELWKAEIEYKEEMDRRENENDANDMYKKYPNLNEPDETARNNIYPIFFKCIDSNEKYKEVNKKIFDIICKEFNILKEEDTNRQTQQKNLLEIEKKDVQQEQKGKQEILINELNNKEPEEPEKPKEEVKIIPKKEKDKPTTNDERAKHYNGGGFPHRPGETVYD